MSSDIAFSLEEWRQARTLDDDRPGFQVHAQLAAPSTRRLVESSVYCCKASWIGPHRRACVVDVRRRDPPFAIRPVMVVIGHERANARYHAAAS
jgi:hypothetical protein